MERVNVFVNIFDSCELSMEMNSENKRLRGCLTSPCGFTEQHANLIFDDHLRTPCRTVQERLGFIQGAAC